MIKAPWKDGAPVTSEVLGSIPGPTRSSCDREGLTSGCNIKGKTKHYLVVVIVAEIDQLVPQPATAQHCHQHWRLHRRLTEQHTPGWPGCCTQQQSSIRWCVMASGLYISWTELQAKHENQKNLSGHSKRLLHWLVRLECRIMLQSYKGSFASWFWCTLKLT
jgi:hypothetical protein